MGRPVCKYRHICDKSAIILFNKPMRSLSGGTPVLRRFMLISMFPLTHFCTGVPMRKKAQALSFHTTFLKCNEFGISRRDAPVVDGFIYQLKYNIFFSRRFMDFYLHYIDFQNLIILLLPPALISSDLELHLSMTDEFVHLHFPN
jgi:hypothetical protein